MSKAHVPMPAPHMPVPLSHLSPGTWEPLGSTVQNDKGDLIADFRSSRLHNPGYATHGKPFDYAETMANAQLFAASKEMFAALEKLLKLERLQCANPKCSCAQCKVVKQAKAAVEKAKGRF